MIGMSTPEHRTRRLSCAHGQVGSQPCGGGERADDGAYGRRAVHGLIPPWVVGARDRRCTIGQTEPRKRTRLDQPSIGGALMMTERFPILTSREKKLLRRLAQGKADRAIAAEIGGTARQVERQREALLKKLQIKSQAQLAEAAYKLAYWPTPMKAP